MIKLGYKIVEFNEITASIQVQPEDGYPVINIQLPIVNGKFPIGDELDNYIQGFLPHTEIQRAHEVAINQESLNTNDIKLLVSETNTKKASTLEQFVLDTHYIQAGDILFKKRVDDLISTYPGVDYDLVSPITSKYWRGLTVEPYIREQDSKLIGIVVTSMTAALGTSILLEVRDLQKACLNSGVPLFGFMVSSVVSKDELTTFVGGFGGKSISGIKSNFVYDEYTPELAKKRKHKLINKDRDIELSKGFEFNGLRFSCDATSTSSLIEAIETAKLVSLPTDYKWRSINNTELLVQLPNLEAMLKESLAFKYKVLQNSWIRKQALNTASTIDQINNI